MMSRAESRTEASAGTPFPGMNTPVKDSGAREVEVEPESLCRPGIDSPA